MDMYVQHGLFDSNPCLINEIVEINYELSFTYSFIIQYEEQTKLY